MSTPDENKSPVGAKYFSMSLEVADQTCKDDEFTRHGGEVQLTPEPGRYIWGGDTWKNGLHIAKMDPDGGLVGFEYFGSEDQAGTVLHRAMAAVKYSKQHEPTYEHRLYKISFKHGVQRLV